jgi:hypothetical protein
MTSKFQRARAEILRAEREETFALTPSVEAFIKDKAAVPQLGKDLAALLAATPEYEPKLRRARATYQRMTTAPTEADLAALARGNDAMPRLAIMAAILDLILPTDEAISTKVST